jgi:hypothetical protein
MTQVFLTKASTSPWATPATMQVGKRLTSNYPATANFWSVANATTSTRIRQTFVPSATAQIDQVVLAASRFGAPTDNIYVSIYDSTATTLLGTSATIPGTRMGNNGNGGWTQFTFATPVSVVSGTTYSLVVDRSGAVDGSNYYEVIGNTTGGYASGILYIYDSTIPGWVQASATSALIFDVDSFSHQVHLQGSGGNGAAGTIGTSGNGGGGGAGGNWGWFLAAGTGTAIVPGTTTFAFSVKGGGVGNASYTEWEAATQLNCYSSTCGGNASGITGGATAGGNGNGTPPIGYFNGFGWLGASGTTTASLLGGGGGGGAAGPNAAGNQNAIAASATGGGGGGAGNLVVSGASSSGATFGSGGAGLTGAPGTSSGAAGTGSSGGAGSTATTTTGSTAGAGGGTDTFFDASHGFGGGGGGAGAATSTGTYTLTGGNGGVYGSGGGGTGYGRGTATFVTGVGGDGLITVYYAPVAAAAVVGVTLSMMGVG